MAVSELHESTTDISQGRSVARPAAKTLPGATKPSAPAAVAGVVSTPRAPAATPKAALTSRAPPAVPGRGGPPPPPPPPPAAAGPPKEMYRVLYNFTGQAGEMNLVKGEEVEVKEKDENGGCYIFVNLTSIGWWMVLKNGTEGWAPSN